MTQITVSELTEDAEIIFYELLCYSFKCWIFWCKKEVIDDKALGIFRPITVTLSQQ